MPLYAYKGYNAAGKSVSGVVDADSPKAIKLNLRKEGIILTEFSESASGSMPSAATFWQRSLFQKSISAQDLAVATRQLATLVGAGIPLLEALVALIDQVQHSRLRSTLADVKQKVNEGLSLGDALSTHPKVFSGLYTNMVRAGETSGALDIVLNRLADFTESQAELKSKLIGALVYPALMMVMAFFVVGMLFVTVIPKLAAQFAAQNAALPLPTRILIATSHFIGAYGIYLLILLALAIYGLRYAIATPKGKKKWDRFLLQSPIFGPLLRMVAINRFCRTLSTLLGSGVPMLKAFDIVKNVVQNEILLDIIAATRAAVAEGESIAGPLKRSGEFPPMVTHMIAIGEKSGQLEEMLGNIARSYDVQIETRLRTMTSLLEPLILVFMGLVVAFIVFSIILPMLKLSSFA